MLYPLMSEQAGVRLIGMDATIVSPSITINRGEDDFALPFTYGGGGVLGGSLKQASSRVIQCFGTCKTSSTNFNGGSFSFYHAATSKLAINAFTALANGNNSDAGVNMIVATSTKNSTDRVLLNPVLGTKRQGGVVMVGTITGSGEVVVGKGDFSAQRESLGIYNITFKRKIFGAAPYVIVTPSTDAVTVGCRIDNLTASGVTVAIAFATSSNLVDRPFNIMVLGYSALDEYGGAFAPLSCTQRNARLALFRVESNALTIGSQIGTLSATSTGVKTITYRRPFRRLGVSFVAPRNNSPTAYVCQARYEESIGLIDTAAKMTAIVSAHTGGALADPSSIDIMVVGFDDPSEY